VINIDTTDSELECESNPRLVEDTSGLDEGSGLEYNYSCDQESDDCYGTSCDELSEGFVEVRLAIIEYSGVSVITTLNNLAPFY